jgi:hypothetical protein
LFQTHTYKAVIKTLKVLLLLVVTGFIVYKLFYAYHINSLFEKYNLSRDVGAWYFLAAAILLMFVNWGLESVKWKFLIDNFEPIDFSTSVKAVFSGVTLSVITPNQIGDFAGRVIHLEVMNKFRGSLVTVIGHTAQVIVTLFFGLFSLLYFTGTLVTQGFILPLSLVLVGLFIAAYLKLGWIYAKLKHLKWVQKFEKYVDVFGEFNTQKLLYILALSFVRYTVFLLQYFLLLHFFQVELPLEAAFACIIGTFCVQSVVPSFLLLEIGLRGASALMFFTLFSNNHEGILLSAYSLWMVNMLFPAMLGMYFIYKVRT